MLYFAAHKLDDEPSVVLADPSSSHRKPFAIKVSPLPCAHCLLDVIRFERQPGDDEDDGHVDRLHDSPLADGQRCEGGADLGHDEAEQDGEQQAEREKVL